MSEKETKDLNNIDSIIKRIDRYKKDWWSESKTKSSSGWTQKQKDAHHNANLLRQRLKDLDKEDTEQINELVKRNGSTTNYKGQWEEYKIRKVQRKIQKKVDTIHDTQESQYEEIKDKFFKRKTAKKQLKQLDNLDKVTKDEYNELLELYSMYEHAKNEGRNITKEEVTLKEESFKKEFRDGTEYDTRDMALRQLNGLYWETYLKTQTEFKGGSYKGIPLYRSDGNGTVIPLMQYELTDKDKMSLPEFLNLTRGIRDARHHGMTLNEKIEATGNMIVVGATAAMLIEAAPAIIAAGGYTINKAIDALNKSGSWIGKGMQNLTNYGGYQLALAGGVTTSASAASTSAIGSLNVTVPSMNSINAFSNFTNAFPKVLNSMANTGSGEQPTRKQMFNQAKKDAGIPTTSSPTKQGWVNKYGSKGEPQRIYEYEVDGQKKYIAEHPADKMGRGNHFHVVDVKYEGQNLFIDGERYINLGRNNPSILQHYPELFEGFK